MTDTKKHVLIVDDEEDLTWSISRGLSRDRLGLEVSCVNSGQEAVDLMSTQKIDLLVTDLKMPGITGYHLIEHVKEQYPDTKIIVMTAFGSKDVSDELKQSGIPGYIEKPFEINDLRDMIYTHLNTEDPVSNSQQSMV